MKEDHMFRTILSSLLYQAPFTLAQIAGLVFAIIQWRKHPRLSMLLVIGLGTALFHTFLFTIFLPVVADVTRLWYLSIYGSRTIRILATLISAGSYAVVVFAACYGFYEAKKLAAAGTSGKC
jgi:hypothetical protein